MALTALLLAAIVGLTLVGIAVIHRRRASAAQADAAERAAMRDRLAEIEHLVGASATVMHLDRPVAAMAREAS